MTQYKQYLVTKSLDLPTKVSIKTGTQQIIHCGFLPFPTYRQWHKEGFRSLNVGQKNKEWVHSPQTVAVQPLTPTTVSEFSTISAKKHWRMWTWLDTNKFFCHWLLQCLENNTFVVSVRYWMIKELWSKILILKLNTDLNEFYKII